ncbi:PREDICTED: putative late blight resistance protein homolog R1A-10 [Erythranthe guttata]|uniref:putative late blight resistance protein homolog R1A-10 n=1 Tax=Erythranthe guttata TaxID=4155 RepID=UPI00064D95D2|nr:PREDICTED: putative late blight resistance protein homolog R1A-10 [Erythranthe guttata]|eukprot:XP_012829327.1 PREDICTED: putative late blight resistance protein homolog R1A-10 [Erythranthe guttata]
MEEAQLLVELKRMVFKSLRCLRFLIVLDDVWDRELCYELAKLFPNDYTGSRILLTTRLYEVAACAYPLNTFRVPFLDKKESWDLLRTKVFGEQESLSYKLEKAGKKIAENCEGLPLTIVTVANILSEANKTIEYWNEVATDKQNSVYKDAYDQMLKVLYRSYDYLPQHLKACFLYIGAFPQNYWVYGYHLTNLWNAEGFLNSKSMHYSHPPMSSTNGTHPYLFELSCKNVTMYYTDIIKYQLHSSFWYLCNKEAAKNKFFYAFNCRADALIEEDVNYQRRLCTRNNVLLAIEDVRNSIASASTVRSLLCIGPHHHYPIPVCLENLRLLKVLETLSIRSYEFPMEVLKLVQLKYLGLSYDGNLPTSISKLWNLQYLIVSRHSAERFVGNVSDMPIEIWNMKELKCVQTGGKDLPHPCEGSHLPNLLELKCVGPQSCTKDVFEKIPNLKALVIGIQLAPDATEILTCFDHISHLHQLQELGCYIMNPTLKTEVVTPLAPLSDFPSSLTKLTLSGLGYPWEEMRKISSLPNLTHLELKFYAFRGPKWEVRDNEFQSLVDLDIQDTDLEQWKFFGNYCCFPSIGFLHIAHCYKLKEIPLTFGTSLGDIQVVDCNPMVVECANKLKRYWDDKYSHENSLFAYVRSSWDG